MRGLLIVIVAIHVALAVMSFFLLPERVAVHFGPGGIPDSWASRETNALVMMAVELPLFVLILISPSAVLRLPARWINLPNKKYWLREENRPAAAARLQIMMYEFAIVLFTFLLFVQFLVWAAHGQDPVRLDEKLMLKGLVLFLIYTAWWCVRMFRRFRLPGTERHG